MYLVLFTFRDDLRHNLCLGPLSIGLACGQLHVHCDTVRAAYLFILIIFVFVFLIVSLVLARRCAGSHIGIEVCCIEDLIAILGDKAEVARSI